MYSVQQFIPQLLLNVYFTEYVLNEIAVDDLIFQLVTYICDWKWVATFVFQI